MESYYNCLRRLLYEHIKSYDCVTGIAFAKFFSLSSTYVNNANTYIGRTCYKLLVVAPITVMLMLTQPSHNAIFCPNFPKIAKVLLLTILHIGMLLIILYFPNFAVAYHDWWYT